MLRALRFSAASVAIAGLMALFWYSVAWESLRPWMADAGWADRNITAWKATWPFVDFTVSLAACLLCLWVGFALGAWRERSLRRRVTASSPS